MSNINITLGGNLFSYGIGAIAGRNFGSISNCYSTGCINGSENSDYIGGLTGANGTYSLTGGLITRCYAWVDVNGSVYSNTLGGLLGFNNGVVIDGFAIGEVNGGEQAAGVGGLIGDNKGDVANCYATGNVNGGLDSSFTGGLLGTNVSGARVTNSYSSGTVRGWDSTAGFVGRNYGVIMRCKSEGEVLAIETSWPATSVGGFAGENHGTISYCYALSDVSFSTTANYVGGLTGYNANAGMITGCYSIGNVSGNNQIGAFVGYNLGTIVSGYHLDTTGPNNGHGTPLDNTNMMIQANFAGWDFLNETANGNNEIWRMCVDGVDYPRLSWEFAQNGDFACGDGVGLADLQALALNWLSLESDAPILFNYACDANGDEKINLEDYAVLSNCLR